MRWIKFFVVISVLLLMGYVGFMYSLEDKKVVVVERELDYPMDKVFPQFENFQQFTRWSGRFKEKGQYKFQYFLPYEGVGSAMRFANISDDQDAGEIFIKDIKPFKSIRYELYQQGEKLPYHLLVNFQNKGKKTKITWRVETPKIPLMKRFLVLNADDRIGQSLTLGLNQLSQVLSGKVDTEVMLSQIKYDSVMVEKQEAKLLLGMNITTMNKKGALQKSIIMHHHKLVNFVTKDLAKREDEYGLPILITELGGLKNKEISYFYGVSLPKQEKLTDYNFVFRNLEKSEVYSIYYKGSYDGRRRAIDRLISAIKKAELRHGQLREFFIEPPIEGQEVVLKISMPVYPNPTAEVD